MKTALGIVVGIGSVIFRYFVMFKLYGYFGIPLGFPAITVLQLVGLVILYNWITKPSGYLEVQWNKYRRKEVGIEEDDNLLYEGFTSLLGGLFIWGSSALLYFQFM